MNKKITIVSFSAILLALSPLAFAFVPPVPPGQIGLDAAISNVVDGIFMILWTVAIVVIVISFVLAGFKFITARGDPSGLKEARNYLIWGLAGTAVVFLAWSAVGFVRGIIGV